MYESIIPVREDSGLSHLDCFCGAGIGEIGAVRAGIKTVFAFDNNKWAVETYNKNFGGENNLARILDAKKLIPESLKIKDIADNYELEEILKHIRTVFPLVDIISGGFPCKPWSLIGARKGEDDNKFGNLALVQCLIIRALQPKAFLIENVDGLVKKNNISYFEDMIDFLQDSGFSVKWKVLCSSDYGCAQKRKRVFVVGIRNDINNEFFFPEPTTSSSVDKLSINDALAGLPLSPDGVNDHECVYLRNDEKPFVDKIPVGGNWKSLPIEDQKTFMKKGFYSGGGRTGALKKIDPNGMANTILSSPLGKATAQILDYGIGEPRRYSVRESLRLQSVPDTFSFADGMPLMKKYERCSGISSIVSYHLFSSIVDTLIC
ncbi:DNA cytosine methyltransferase [Photobacterium kishitanii]|uniref:Cytosine-specific methyltransferase n=1 Tax=Photobacterium kishitanii TaxID=318456 RepID=A0A2T3KM24_9GAMM|nr:DNA (cytosine-5-)-methyltransferase [Photobacterium kishitanii]PSV00857.1 hypothetical protein C9J27_02190 [Photobacterium kishitanii]